MVMFVDIFVHQHANIEILSYDSRCGHVGAPWRWFLAPVLLI